VSGKPSFVTNTLLLTAAGGIARLLGAVYRIFLSRAIGDDGIGLFQMAFDLNLVLTTIAISGLPLAISKLIAERYEEGDTPGAERLFRVSFIGCTCIGVVCAIALYAGAPFLIHTLLQEPRALLPLRYMALSLVAAFMAAPLRGYFQGRQQMLPRAISETLEQLVRVGAIFTLVWLWQSRGTEYAAGGATLGVSLGAVAGFLYILGEFWRQREKGVAGKAARKLSLVAVISQLIKVALPVILGGLIWPLMRLADTLLVHMRLISVGFTPERATELFGQFSGQAGPLINLPSILTVSLAASLLPSIAAALTRRDIEELHGQCNLALKLAIDFGLPAATGLFLLATPVATALYGNPEAGPVIASYSWVILFLLLFQTTTSILQGIGKMQAPVLAMVAGVLLKSCLTFWLCGLPHMHIYGAGWASALGMALAVLVNLAVIFRELHLPPVFRGLLWAPGGATILMACLVHFGYLYIASRWASSLALLLIIPLGVFVYGAVLVLAGGFTREELKAIPGINTLVSQLPSRIIPSSKKEQ